MMCASHERLLCETHMDLLCEISLVINLFPVGGHSYLKTQESNDSVGVFFFWYYFYNHKTSVCTCSFLHLCPFVQQTLNHAFWRMPLSIETSPLFVFSHLRVTRLHFFLDYFFLSWNTIFYTFCDLSSLICIWEYWFIYYLQLFCI